MKLEKQVVSLELAKKLKELGVPQTAHFEWQKWKTEGSRKIEWEVHEGYGDFTEDWYSAFTVAELGEMLQTDQGLLIPVPVDGRWNAPSPKNGQVVNLGRRVNITEADARAKMLIYLIENNLIKV